MQKKILKEAESFRNKNKRRRTWKKIISVLACVVVFCTTYALILPAITLEKPTYCGKDEHIHAEECFDVSGNLICSVEEHEHIDECFINPEKQTSDDAKSQGNTKYTKQAARNASAQKSVSAQAGTNRYGHNPDDGSIWWDIGTGLVQVTDLEENTPYLLFGFAGNNAMADEFYEKQGSSYLKAIPKETIEDYNDYKRWYFEKADENGNYYVYYMKDDNIKHYLQFGDPDPNDWRNEIRQLILVTDKAQANVFNVSKVTNPSYSNHYAISTVFDSRTYYLNSYYDDKPLSEGYTTHWLAYAGYTEGSFIKLCEYDQTVDTANRLSTENNSNSVINIFDYWTRDQHEPDHGREHDHLDEGINKNHNMKFYSSGDLYSTIEDLGSMNNQAAKSLLNLGIVQNKLVNGYPVLSGDEAITGGSTESLDYLFNPKISHEGKLSYSGVGGLLRINDDGYHYFNSQDTMAEFIENENNLAIYDRPGVVRSGDGTTELFGQFFPFNDAPHIMLSKSNDSIMNHYFGLTITTRFYQMYGGFTDVSGNKPTTFSFSGDDDVWIFIDNVLVADLGGCHDSVGVDIDYSTGKVIITYSDWYGNKLTKETTLYDEYAEAGATSVTRWNGNTFANNTTHTMKFFYLERGNWDSNLNLKYNLTEIPDTAIYKVDQLGNPLGDTDFAVFAADDDYNLLNNKNGQKVDVPNPQYDAAGNIVDSNNNIIAKALYRGTTDDYGKMSFADPDGMPYPIDELEDLFGTKFILREIEPPEGYRNVSDNINLRFWHGKQTILVCDNSRYTGTRATTNQQVTATDTIHLYHPYKGSKSVQYCDENGKVNGTLFAITFKYTGDIDQDGNATSLNDDANWTPIYGNDKVGYNLIDMEGKGLLEGALEAGREAQKYENIAFAPSSSSSMQLTLENLPGSITSYYRMLDDSEIGKTRYTIGYYWTDQDSIDKATVDNTYRVDTFAGVDENGLRYPAFERLFGADIHIPNLVNDILVEKIDETGKFINGAKFALYQVQQQSNGEIYYLAGNGTYTPIDENAVPDPETGVITTPTHRITPLKTDVTRTLNNGNTNGTAAFNNVDDGQYIVKEIKPPPGYRINKTDIMLLVTPDTIYANAGTADDNVMVGRGPGYVVSTFDVYASEGMIDNTLSWIYAQLKITGESTSFNDPVNPDKYKGYLTENNTGNTSTNEADAVRSYLQYNSGYEGNFFNYIPNTNRIKAGNVQNPSSTRRLWTSTGWAKYELYQDYDYGKNAKLPTATYADWRGQNLVPLFSRSTYITVIDSQDTSLDIKKVDSLDTSKVLADAQFRLYRLAEDGKTKEYYSRNAAGEISWVTDSSAALVVTTKSDGLSDKRFTNLRDGEYYLEETKPPPGYNDSSKPVQFKLDTAKLTLMNPNLPNDRYVQEHLEDNNLYTYTLLVPNSSGYELPETGGEGTYKYTIGGAVVIAAGLLYGYIWARKRERRFD